jgi:purine-cytosine permease-like protein
MTIINIKADKMRYQKNSSAYGLVLLSLITGMIGLFMLINYDQFITEGDLNMRIIPNLRVGVEILIGIIMMLMTFLGAEKVKLYDYKWSFYWIFVLAGVNVFRIFNLPIYAEKQGWIPESTMYIVMAFYAATAGLLIAAGVISARKVIILRNHMKELNT